MITKYLEQAKKEGLEMERKIKAQSQKIETLNTEWAQMFDKEGITAKALRESIDKSSRLQDELDHACWINNLLFILVVLLGLAAVLLGVTR